MKVDDAETMNKKLLAQVSAAKEAHRLGQWVTKNDHTYYNYEA